MPIHWPLRRPLVAPADIPAELVFQLLDIQETVVNDWRHSEQEFHGFPEPVHDQLAGDMLYQDALPAEDDEYSAKPAWKPEECRLLLFGVDQKGQSICCQTRYYPYIYVEVPNSWDRPAQIQFVASLAQKQRNLQGIKFTAEHKHHLSGWQSDPDPAKPLVRRLNLYLKLRFNSFSQQQQCIKYLKGLGHYPIWEWERTLKLPLKFIDDMNLKAAGWVRVTKHVVPEYGYCSSCQIEVEAKTMGHVRAIVPEILTPAPFVVASVDIEAYSATHRFPDPANRKDVVIGIGISVAKGDEPLQGFYLALTPGLPSVQKALEGESPETLMTFATERELLEGYRDFLVLLDPDIVLGYNINRFDWKYMARRLPANSRFFRQSRIVMRKTPLEEVAMNSAAFGQNIEHHIHMPGRLVMDIMTLIKRNPSYRLRDYKLDTVAEHFLKSRKIDLPAQEMFACYEAGQTEKIGLYCIQDTKLPLQLMTRLMMLTNIFEMGRLTSTFPYEVVLRGQQQKIVNFFFREAHKENFVFTTFAETKVPDYEGATVLEPVVGFYDGIVVTLDYSSLYPSILIDNNLSHDTYLGTSAGSLPLESVRQIGSDYFVKHQEGLLSKMERQLLAERKNVRGRMKQEKDPAIKNILDAMQNSIKTVCNSIYGFTGANTNLFNCPAVARCITNMGRQMILATKELIEKTYNAKIIYGDTDSVFILFSDAKTPADAFRFGTEAADLVTKHFGGGVIQLAMEKIMTPFLLLAKKRYVGIKYESIEDPGKLYAKGLETVRRDVSPFVANTYQMALDAILQKRDILLAQKVVFQRLCDLEDGKIPFQEFEKSVQLKAEYKSENLPQLVVMEKMKARNPGSEPIAGDRFKYVMVETDGDSKSAKAEDPGYALEQKLPLDYLSYLEALKTPISNLFEAFTDDCSPVFRRTEAVLKARKLKVMDLGQFLGGECRLLDDPIHREMPVLLPKAAKKGHCRQRDLSEMLGVVAPRLPVSPPPKKAKKKKTANAVSPGPTRKLVF